MSSANKLLGSGDATLPSFYPHILWTATRRSLMLDKRCEHLRLKLTTAFKGFRPSALKFHKWNKKYFFIESKPVKCLYINIEFSVYYILFGFYDYFKSYSLHAVHNVMSQSFVITTFKKNIFHSVKKYHFYSMDKLRICHVLTLNMDFILRVRRDFLYFHKSKTEVKIKIMRHM